MNTATMNEITQSYDPDGHTRPDEAPDAVLAIFRGCRMDEPCGLTLDDVADYLAELKDVLDTRITEAAERSAALFVDEFGVPLDPSTTDWDSVAWSEDIPEIGLCTSERIEYGWPIYQAALVAETHRLCREAR